MDPEAPSFLIRPHLKNGQTGDILRAGPQEARPRTFGFQNDPFRVNQGPGNWQAG